MPERIYLTRALFMNKINLKVFTGGKEISFPKIID